MRPHDRYKLVPQSSSLNISFFSYYYYANAHVGSLHTDDTSTADVSLMGMGISLWPQNIALWRPPQMNNDIAKGKRKCRLIRTKCVHELWADLQFYFVTQIIIMCNVMCVQEEDWTASSSFSSQILKDRYTLLCALMMTTTSKTIIIVVAIKW